MFRKSFILLFWITYVKSKIVSENTCSSPEQNECKLINDCQPVLKRLTHKPLLTSDIIFLQNSTCGFEGPYPKVCCPANSTSTSSRAETSNKPDPFDFQVATNNLLPDTDTCGLYNFFRTFGRDHPDLYEFPWMVLLNYRNKKRTDFKCGGVLISKRYVLTAANCVVLAEKLGWKLISVRLGEYNVQTDPDCVDYGFGEECASPAINVDVEKTLSHENYTLPHLGNDIALVRLNQEVEFSDFIQPICLPVTSQEANKNYIGKKFFISGWSRMGSATYSNIKLKDQIFVRDNSNCSSKLPAPVTENQLCASGEIRPNWCKGDSGGPLMAVGVDKIKKITRWYAVGVSSFGLRNSCTVEVYTKVAKYVPWIVSKLEP